MFESAVNTNIVTGEAGDQFFSNICVPAGWHAEYYRDYSFLTTLRLLLKNRVSNNDTFTFIEQNVGTTKEGLISSLSPQIKSSAPFLYIANACGNSGIKEMLLSETSDSWIELTDIETFLKKYVDLTIFSNKNGKSAIILINNAETDYLGSYHLIQSLIPRYIPFYFKDASLTNDERDLLKSLTKSVSNGYDKCVNKLAQQYDLSSIEKKIIISNFFSAYKKTMLEQALNKCDSIRRGMEALIAQYNERIAYLEAANALYASVLSGDKTEIVQEIVEYTTHRKDILFKSLSSNEFQIVIKTYLESYDLDIFHKFLDKGSFRNLQTNRPAEFSNDCDFEFFLKNLFCEHPKFKVKIYGIYKINMAGYVSVGHDDFDGVDQYEENPHLRFYNCLGSYLPLMQEALQSSNFIQLLELCSASAKSMNFVEIGQTVFRFLGSLLSNRNKVIEYEDGTTMTPVEAMRKMKELKEAENNEAN